MRISGRDIVGSRITDHPEFPRRLCPGTPGPIGLVLGQSPPCRLSPSTTRTVSSRYEPVYGAVACCECGRASCLQATLYVEIICAIPDGLAMALLVEAEVEGILAGDRCRGKSSAGSRVEPLWSCAKEA